MWKIVWKCAALNAIAVWNIFRAYLMKNLYERLWDLSGRLCLSLCSFAFSTRHHLFASFRHCNHVTSSRPLTHCFFLDVLTMPLPLDIWTLVALIFQTGRTFNFLLLWCFDFLLRLTSSCWTLPSAPISSLIQSFPRRF